MFISFQFILFFNEIHSERIFPIKCEYPTSARDQTWIDSSRHRRFVLFPEFSLWLNDWRYLNHPKEFLYWISNYYPQLIPDSFIRTSLHLIINDINRYIDHRIIRIQEAQSANHSNFNYNFFDYHLCPENDPNARIENVENIETMLIYSPELIRKSRYRAHGGISINSVDNSSRSLMKFNTHHQFLLYEDFEYDPVIYTCTSDERHCHIDLYSVMLHETLHGFGIEVNDKFESRDLHGFSSSIRRRMAHGRILLR